MLSTLYLTAVLYLSAVYLLEQGYNSICTQAELNVAMHAQNANGGAKPTNFPRQQLLSPLRSLIPLLFYTVYIVHYLYLHCHYHRRHKTTLTLP